MARVPGLYLLSGQALEDSPWNGADFWQESTKPSPLRVRWARIYRATLTPMRERLIIFWWSALSILPLPRSLWQENGIFLLIVKFLLKSLMKSKRQDRLLFSGRNRWAEIKQSVISVWRLKTQQFLGVGRRTGFTPWGNFQLQSLCKWQARLIIQLVITFLNFD